MKPGFVIGVALSGAVVTFLAALVGNAIGIILISVTAAVVLRTLLVVLALYGTALFWWRHRGYDDRREALFTGLALAWLVNIANWTGSAFAGRLLGERWYVVIPFDLVLWLLVALGLTAYVTRGATRGSAYGSAYGSD